MQIETKYSVGEVVYRACTVGTTKQHPCPDCLGTQVWKAISPVGEEYTFTCPRCSSRYRSEPDLALTYNAFEPTTQRLTIGSIRVDTASDSQNEYMAYETGIGSGNIYRENTLFPSQDQALEAAKIMASEQNTTTPWVVKQFNRSLDISDYELSNAMLKLARDKRIKASVDVEMLFEDLRDCETLDEVKDRLEEGFKPRGGDE